MRHSAQGSSLFTAEAHTRAHVNTELVRGRDFTMVGLYTVLMYLVLMYCEEIVKGNTLVTHHPTGIGHLVGVANSLSY